MRDLTTTTGNPTSALQVSYQDLMKLDCVEKLRETAIGIVTASGGISEKNRKKFVAVASNEKCINRLRFYLTNFLLSGSGLAVLASYSR